MLWVLIRGTCGELRSIVYASTPSNLELTISSLQNKTDTCANSVDPDETTHKSRLIRIFTVCHSVSDFRLKPLFASMDLS